jgi:hypothetical protein
VSAANRSFGEDARMNLLNVQQLATFLGVAVTTVQGLTRKRGRDRDAVPIPYLKIGRRIYFRRESVERWIAARETTR